MAKSTDNFSALCLECGLCCNGVIFADVRLQPGDDPERLRSIGLSISMPHSALRAPHFPQPCAALDGCRCRIYADRPAYCRQFDCLLLKGVKAGRVAVADALDTIHNARQKMESVLRLLRKLGDTDEHVPLAKRFRRTARRLDQVGLDKGMSATYGELTLAFHDLNFLLNDSFYR
jgi:Fe-S-cluster containining protein